MCIRDSLDTIAGRGHLVAGVVQRTGERIPDRLVVVHNEDCLLYTSDAADERSRVDLGGRRIIKKKIRRIGQGRSVTSRILIDTAAPH